MKQMSRALAVLLLTVTGVVLVGGPAQAAPYTYHHVTPGSGGTYFIVNDMSRKCIDIRDWNFRNGATVQQYSCFDTNNQRFVLENIGRVNNVSAWRIKPMFLTYQNPDKCLDVLDGRFESGQRIQTWDCSPGWQQMFEFVPGPNGLYQMRPVYDHKCVDVPPADRADLTELRQWDCFGADFPYTNQWWFFAF
jgi:hypothetical protein